MKYECCKLAFYVRSAIVVLRYELTETLSMTGSNCGKRINLGFIDLNSEIDEYHASAIKFKCAVYHHYRLNERHFWANKAFFSPTFLFCAAPDAIPHFCVVNVNSISSLNKIKIASVSSCSSRITACFSLCKDLKPKSPWKNGSSDTSAI